MKRKCQHRDARVVRSYYDRNGAPRVKHAFDVCGAPAAAVDLYDRAFCADHLIHGEFGIDAAADVNLDEVLARLVNDQKGA